MNDLLKNFSKPQRLFVHTAASLALLCTLSLWQRVQAQGFAVVNAASYGAQGLANENTQVDAYRRTLAPDLITAAFGNFVTQNGQTFTASTNPLPTTLGGVRLQVNGIDAPLFFVSPTQINFAVPPNLADTTNVTLRVFNSNNAQATGSCVGGGCIIARSSLGIFTIKATGTGAPAALTTFDGVTYTPVFNTDLSPANVDAGTRERRNVLVLYGTGIRRIPATNPTDGNGVAEALKVTLQGVPLSVEFAGPAPGFVGLDQINVLLPPEISGFGLCRLVVQAATPLNPVFLSNAVELRMGGPLKPIISQRDLNFGETVNGELTNDDQVQLLNDGSGRTYFFDAYRFTTTQPNQAIGIDMRRTGVATNQLDSTVLVYRIVSSNGVDNLDQLAADDDLGSADGAAGNNEGVRATRNALLLAVVPTPGRYAIFATTANRQQNGTGAYSLRLFEAPIRQLTYGQNLTGESIAATDIKNSEEVIFDVYYFNANTNDNVDIRTTAPGYISLLTLQQNGADFFLGKFGDAVTQGAEARVTQRITEPGIYLIYVTPFERNKFSNYSLSLQRSASLAEDQAEAALTPRIRRSDERGTTGRTMTRTIQE